MELPRYEHPDDPLRDFIAANRDSFDDERPSPAVWNAVERDLPAIERRLSPRSRTRQTAQRPKREGVVRQLYPYWRKAAAACMLLTIGLLGGLLLADERGGRDVEGSGLADRAAELERFYQREIDRRLRLVDSYQPEPELRRELASMNTTDFRAEPELSSPSGANERALIEAMAQEYQAKLDALEHVLDRLHAAEQSQPRLNAPGPRSTEEL